MSNQSSELNFDLNTGVPIDSQQNNNVINQSNPAKSNKYNKNALFAYGISIVSLFVFGWLSFCSLGLCVAAYNEIKKKEKYW